MSIENTVYQMLAGLAAINQDIAGRIYFERNPNQTENQYLTYTKPSHRRPLGVDGDSEPESADFQIDIFSPSEDTARNIRDAIVSAFHGKTISGYPNHIQLALIESDTSDGPTDPDIFRYMLSMSLVFNSAP